MEMNRSTFLYGMTCTAAALLAGCEKKGKETEPQGAVKKDLQAAFDGESTASAKYALYAKECKKAGYLSVAALFEAASYAESIHAAKHAKVALKLFKVKMTATLKPFAFKNVKSALEDAAAGETYEYTDMYQGMISRAKNAKSNEAVATFDNARKAEIEHGRMYRAALADLNGWKAAGKKFWVCPVCGFTTDKPLDAKSDCPYCGMPAASMHAFG